MPHLLVTVLAQISFVSMQKTYTNLNSYVTFLTNINTLLMLIRPNNMRYKTTLVEAAFSVL